MKSIICYEDHPADALSYSQVQQFLKCKKAWWYSYNQNLKKRYEAPYFTKGKLAHVAMAAAWNWKYTKEYVGLDCPLSQMLEIGSDVIDEEYIKFIGEAALTDDELEETKTLPEDAKSIFEKALIEFGPENWKVCTIDGCAGVELHFKVAMRGFSMFHGFIDLIAMNTITNQAFQIDFKFRSSLSGDEEEAYNLQNSIYSYILIKHGVSIAGSMTFQALNTPASLPSVNKNGTISRAKIKTDWATYSNFCVVNGQDPDLYAEEMIPKLAEIEWTHKTMEYRNLTTMNNVWEQIIKATASDIKSKRTKYTKSVYPRNCGLCSFAPLCQAELRGYDFEDIIKTQYTEKYVLEEEEV